jgi:hypothetical protein
VTTTTQTSFDITLGLVNDQTCFLTGIGGQILGNPLPPGGVPRADATGAGIGIFDVGDMFWHFKGRVGVGGGIGGSAVCIDSVANRSIVSWSDNLSQQPLGDGSLTSPRRCFLKSVWGTSGFTNNCSFNPFVIINTNPTTGGPVNVDGHVCNEGGDSGFGGVEVVCVDTLAPQDAGGVEFRPTSGPDPADTTVPVKSDSVCSVLGIDGNWGNLDHNGLDGIFLVSWQGHPLPTWLARWTFGRHGTVQCIAGP